MSYDYEMRPGESMENYYRRLAKVADQRLVRLEQLTDPSKSSYNADYKGAKTWAYARAAYDIETKWGGDKEAPRFNTKPPANANQLQAKINDIKDFLKAPTSTKQGIKDGYKKKADTMRKDHGLDVNWEDWAHYLDRFGASLYDKYGSKVMNRVIKTVQSMAASDPELDAKKLHSLALMRKDGGYKFNYVKVDGTDGGYDVLVDKAIHEIFRKRKDLDDIYSLIVGK